MWNSGLIESEHKTGAARAARLGILAAAATGLIVAGAFAGARLLGDATLAEKRRAASFSMAGNAAALQTKLQKFRLALLALSGDPELLRALRTPDQELRMSLNKRFAELATASEAAAIYLVDRRGVTFAASNYLSEKSFVGQDYSFRDYFRQALQHRDAEEFAIGTVSGEPGLYLSRSIASGQGDAQGVIVLKLRFTDIESYWSDTERLIIATDSAGRIIVTPVEPLRLKHLGAITSGVLQSAPSEVASVVGDGPVLATSQLVAEASWTIISFEPLRAALASPRLYGGVSGASLTAVLLGGLTMMWRRIERDARKAREIAAYRAALESAVDARTRELQSSYRQLSEETDSRQRAQESLRLMQDEIIQLNRLAIIGQFSAKFAHEINQPLTAMRNYVDSSAKLLAAGEHQLVAENLETMSGLIMRAGRITTELRGFSQKRRRMHSEVEVGRAIDGALLIASSALAAASIAVERDGDDEETRVKVDQVRLEQVFLNVIQNAIDALRNRSDGRIVIACEAADATLVIRIADNGPGVEQPDFLFTPFRSEKETGLGLGLSISREILADFGGDIRHVEIEDDGAAFEISLPRSRS